MYGAGNLIQVSRLTDRSNPYSPVYSPTYYEYTNAAFPHYITGIIDPSGNAVARNYYDQSGKLTEVDDANGNKTQFIHNLANDVEVVVDRLNHTNTYVYDTRGNVIVQTNALGQVTTMAYDLLNNKTNDVVFANGVPYATNVYVYSTNLLIASINPLGFSNTYTYNGFGQLVITTNALGKASTNYYDPSSGNLLGTSDALGDPTTNFYDHLTGLLIGSVDVVRTSTTNSYDASGNLLGTATFNAMSLTILSSNSFAYDSIGNQTNSTVWRHVGVSWVPSVTCYVFDAQNRVIQTIDPDGGTNSVVYNAIGKQSATIDKLARTTSYFYDNQGRLFQTTYPDGTSEFSYYDAGGNRTNSVDRAGRSTFYVYDALNRLVQTIYPDGASAGSAYDDLGRVKFTVDARGTTNTFGYDLAGRRIAVTNAWGTPIAMVSLYAFDANGNQTIVTNGVGTPAQTAATNVFDVLNRQIQVLYPDGTKTSTTYDAGGRRIASVDQANITNWFGYDGAGRLTSVTNAVGSGQQTITRFDYDEAGNEIHQADALNRTNTFAYDAMGRRTSRSLPGGQSESFVYDLAGNLLRHTDFNALVITNQYDAMNRLAKRWKGTTVLESYAYDSLGELTNRVDSSGAYGWVYDDRGRATTNSTPVATLFYAYDANGNLTSLSSSTPNGVTNFYQYDALNRLTNVVDNSLSISQKNTAYTYDGVGDLQTLSYPNSLTNLYQYDSLNRLTNLTWKVNGAQRGDFSYQLGKAGNRTNLIENVNSAPRTNAWVYDSLYRLTSETISNTALSGALGYFYDAVGNRTSRTGSVGGVTAANNTFDVNDWIDNDSNTNNANPNFDANGNTRTNGSIWYGYDWANRLVAFTNGSTVVTFVYNADNHRVGRTSPTATSVYLVSAINPSGYPQVVEEFTVTGGTTIFSRAYTWGSSLISFRQADSKVRFYGYDGHGSVRFLTGPGGVIQDSYSYDAFGNLLTSSTTLTNNYLYSGYLWDPDVGQYSTGPRTYNPSFGRFWEMDTFEGNAEDPLSLHKYLYCQGNPVNMVDPAGQKADFSPADAAAIGREVHQRIGQKFTLGFSPAQRVTAESVFTVFGLQNPQSGKMIDGIKRLFPDLVDREHHEIYEIKPLNVRGAAGGLIQLSSYIIALNKLDPSGHSWGVPIAAEHFNSFSVFFTASPFAAIEVAPPVFGMIFYKAEKPQDFVQRRANNVAEEEEADIEDSEGVAAENATMGAE
jgi:RHS repeat-associated protein